jgi:hypothetical protein
VRFTGVRILSLHTIQSIKTLAVISSLKQLEGLSLYCFGKDADMDVGMDVFDTSVDLNTVSPLGVSFAQTLLALPKLRSVILLHPFLSTPDDFSMGLLRALLEHLTLENCQLQLIRICLPYYLKRSERFESLVERTVGANRSLLHFSLTDYNLSSNERLTKLLLGGDDHSSLQGAYLQVRPGSSLPTCQDVSPSSSKRLTTLSLCSKVSTDIFESIASYKGLKTLIIQDLICKNHAIAPVAAAIKSLPLLERLCLGSRDEKSVALEILHGLKGCNLHFLCLGGCRPGRYAAHDGNPEAEAYAAVRAVEALQMPALVETAISFLLDTPSVQLLFLDKPRDWVPAEDRKPETLLDLAGIDRSRLHIEEFCCNGYSCEIDNLAPYGLIW